MRSGVAITVGFMVLALTSCCATRPAVRSTVPAGPSVPTSADFPLVNRLGVEPKTVDAGASTGVMIHYKLARPASVGVDLVDEEGRVARTLEAGLQSAGRQELRWDVRAEDGTSIPAGVYRYVIKARDGKGHEAVDDPSLITGGEELIPTNFNFDRQTKMFRWSMPRAGYARLRIGIQGFPHLRTLMDWQPFEAGLQTLFWDGRDASGLVQLMDHPRLSVKLFAFALPDNVILVRGASDDKPNSGVAAYPPLQWGKSGALHAQHSRATCHEAQPRIEFPKDIHSDSQGRPILVGRVPVRVVMDQRDAPPMVNAKFEVMLYEDLTFLAESEEGTNPFNYVWNTASLPPGPHLLTVNLMSYDDHYGVVTQPVIIERPQ